MLGLDKFDSIFVIWAFILQVCLLVLFAIRKINLDLILKYGWAFYLLSITAVIVSIFMIRAGKPYSFWLAGFIFLAWAILGIWVEYILNIQWRSPIVWPVFVPYVLLYLSSLVFYWWPLGNIQRPLWFIYGVLFAISTMLNITSHR